MGPLAGYTVIEIAGIGPGPFGAMMLADMGASVIRVERPGGGTFSAGGDARLDLLNRGKRCIAVNLKTPEGVDTVLRLIEKADALVEGFRPGVMEKLGLGPDICLQRNPKLVFGRMTGWGQEGTLARAAGHDINYIALAGALHPIGRRGEKPTIPLNLVGDFGGGGLMLAFGVVCALLEAARSGSGQVVDAAMVDGSAALMTSLFAAHQSGFWNAERGTNMLDSGAHFYDVYECADGHYVSVGAIEPQFYREFLQCLGLDSDPQLAQAFDMEQWPAMKQRVTEIFKTRSRAEWCDIFADRDACFAPVLAMGEVKDHPHIKARQTIVETDSIWQPHPAPRFSRTRPELPRTPVAVGADTEAVLREFGFSENEVSDYLARGAIVQG